MKITVIGTGYVGLVSGTCFSEMGNQVTCVDSNRDKISLLKKGIVSIYEPGLEQLVVKNISKENLYFSSDIESAILDAEIIFIAVGTPMGEDGSADLKNVLAVAKEIGKNISKEIIIVNKSTVPVGTADKVTEVIQSELIIRQSSVFFTVVSNPEFLKEGTAISDFMSPDRVVIGSDSDVALTKLKELYLPFTVQRERFVTMSVRSAEMTKYAANTMLATKISFINEIANICEKVGADVNSVRLGIGSDARIGYSFIYPGCGYGGSCFPKDVKALKKMAEDYGYIPELISAVENVNNRQKLVIVDKIISRFGENLKGTSFGLWGLSFKPGTDDMREAPSIFVVNELLKRGATIKAYDPKAISEAKSFYLKDLCGISYCDKKYDVLDNSDALILLTEWKEFRSPDFGEIKSLLNQPIIFDGRNQYVIYDLKAKGFEYFSIGK